MWFAESSGRKMPFNFQHHTVVAWWLDFPLAVKVYFFVPPVIELGNRPKRTIAWAVKSC
jgi:hypothetical protein